MNGSSQINGKLNGVYNRFMSPRPRQNTDLEILYAAFRAIARLGPSKLTLADVAREADVSPASLVQRFGSKRALLLAASSDAAGGHAFIFAGYGRSIAPRRPHCTAWLSA